MRVKFHSTSIAVLALVILMPFAHASSSGINFLDATVSDKSDAYTNSVSLNENQTIIASSYSTFIELHNSTTLELIKRYSFNREVYHIEFSPDGKFLAASLAASEAVPDSLRIIDVENLELLSAQAKGNNRPGNLDYSPDGTKIIAPNMNNGAQIYDSVTMAEIDVLNGAHTSDVTCTSFSKTGDFLITGDEIGRIVLWNDDGEQLNVDIVLNEEIIGCDFSTMDAKFAVSTVGGNVYSYNIAGSSLQSISLGSNYGLSWSESEDILYVLESDSSPALIALDGSTFEVIHQTHLVHKSLDFAIVESDKMLTNIYVATDSNHIAIYGKPQYPEGYGVMGSDFDGDGIPDTLDNDDDGDSYEDDYDFNCVNSTVCSRDPDLDTIRSMVFEISGDTLVIEDIYTMSQSDTYLFRNLTRRGIISDQRISYEETNMLEDAFCSNMDQNDYVQKLRNSIELSVGQVSNGTLQCNIVDGLSFTKTFDKAQLRFAISTTFDIEPNVTLPLTITLNSQINTFESSITHKMENHPILINQIDSDNELIYTLWWNDGISSGPSLNFSADEQADSTINSIIEKINNNLENIIAISLAVILSAWILIRRRNLNSIILDESEFEDGYESGEIEQISSGGEKNFGLDNNEDSNPIEPINGTEYYSLVENDEEIIVDAIPAEDTPINRRAFTIDDDSSESENIIRRRTGKIQRNTEGPIMSTKRKRLDGKLDIPGEQKISKKKVVGKIKTRKVATSAKVRKVRSVKKDD